MKYYYYHAESGALFQSDLEFEEINNDGCVELIDESDAIRIALSENIEIGLLLKSEIEENEKNNR